MIIQFGIYELNKIDAASVGARAGGGRVRPLLSCGRGLIAARARERINETAAAGAVAPQLEAGVEVKNE